MKVSTVLAVGAMLLFTSACSTESPGPESSPPSAAPTQSARVSTPSATPSLDADEAAGAEWREQNQADLSAEDAYVSTLVIAFGDDELAAGEYREAILDVGYAVCWQLNLGADAEAISAGFTDPFLGQAAEIAAPTVIGAATAVLCPEFEASF